MDDVISLSSDDSDVEIVSFSEFTKSDPLPLSEVRVDIEAVNNNIPRLCIDLTDPRWSFPELKLRKRLDFINSPVIDLSECSETELQADGLPQNNSDQLKESGTCVNNFSLDEDVNLLESSLRDRVSPQTDCGVQKPSQRHLSSPSPTREENCLDTPAVKLTRLPFLESCVTELKATGCSILFTKDFSQTSLCQPNNDSKEFISDLKTSAFGNSHMEPEHEEVMKSSTKRKVNGKEQESQDLQTPADCPETEGGPFDAPLNNHNTRENKLDGSLSLISIPSSTFTFQAKVQNKALDSKPEQLELNGSACNQRCPSGNPSSNTCERFEIDSFSHASPASHHELSRVDQSPHSEQMVSENSPEWQWEMETYGNDMGSGSPASLLWQSDGEDDNEVRRFGVDFRAVSREDRQYVCQLAFKKATLASTRDLINEGHQDSGASEVLCRQSLSLVYSTIDENYPEGTLQLLSDLLQPGYYPPKDITSHLLRGILLDPQCPYHFCVQAFNLLMRTQRHHRVNKSTVPWDWELLTSVMLNEDQTKRHRCETVRMFLEYVVQTLEDDFRARCSSSSLHHTIAKATLSCDQRFPWVKDVLRWLFSAIMKSTELGNGKQSVRERDEQLRIVPLFQRMLSLALEVDHSPALSSAKLSHELFHMVISHMPLRAHRMLLLESLQSKLLRCKLLEQLMDYACPQKVCLPMSLSLLLHFLKNCTLAPDPMDGVERWKKWEELIHLLWMLLLSYNQAMKGCLNGSSVEQREKVGTLVYKPEDMVTKPAVREAVEDFLSRSLADLDQALPLHVEESLTYLQDHLLDVCQC